MRYVIARKKEKDLDISYRIFSTDALKMLCNLWSDGKAVEKRWIDLIEESNIEPAPEDTRTTKEIVDDIWNKMKGGASNDIV